MSNEWRDGDELVIVLVGSVLVEIKERGGGHQRHNGKFSSVTLNIAIR